MQLFLFELTSVVIKLQLVLIT